MEITILLYLFKACLCSAIFAAVYGLLLRKETFHRLNRTILLASIAASLVLPAVNWNSAGISSPALGRERTQVVTTVLNNIVVTPDSENVRSAEGLSTAELLMALYLAGVFFMFAKNGAVAVYIGKTIRKSRKMISPQGRRMYVSRKKTPSFCWMGRIVVSEDDVAPDCGGYIVRHEEAHASLGHSIDLTLAEIFTGVLWFWPSAWMLKRYLKEVHEYEADRRVLETDGCSARTYQMLMIKKVAGPKLYNAASCFNYNSLKKRITMMNKKDSGRWALAKTLCLIPAVGAAVCLAACVGNGENKSAENNAEVKDTATVDNSKAETTVAKFDSKVAARNSETDTVMDKCEVMPEFPGGTESLMKYLRDNIKYPQKALEEGLSGRVIALFVVDRDGGIDNIEILKSTNQIFENEAIRVIKTMPKWKPGKDKGKTVRCRYVLPVVFRIN